MPDKEKKEPEEQPKPQDTAEPEKLPEMGQPEFKGGREDDGEIERMDDPEFRRK